MAVRLLGDGIQRIFCGDGNLARGEDCDAGEALLGDLFACNSDCRCNPGFTAVDGVCECETEMGVRAAVEESSRLQNADNDVTLSVSVSATDSE